MHENVEAGLFNVRCYHSSVLQWKVCTCGSGRAPRREVTGGSSSNQSG